MGREARCHAAWDGGEGEVKALLETHELILRGDHDGKWPLSALTNVAADGPRLRLVTPAGPLALTLGEAAALSWARKIATPPPTLAVKLGICPEARVLVVGDIDDAVLADAVTSSRAASPQDAKLTLAVVRGLADLDRALAAAPTRTPIWLVNVKGPKSPLGENAIRTEMRGRGYIDTKTASVSDTLSATRYGRRP